MLALLGSPLGLILITSAALSWLYAVAVWCPDSWWHLATGRYIVEQGAIPSTDPFSYTVKGAPWRGINWLADLLYYGAYAAFGMAGVVLLKMVNAFAMLTLLGLTLRKWAVPRTIVVALLVLVGVLVQPRYSMARPQMLGGLLLAATLYLGSRWWQDRDWTLWLIPAVTLIWLQVHGTALVGAAALGVLLIATLIERRERRALIQVCGAISLVAVIFAATASGRDILYHSRGLSSASVAIQMTAEWRRPSLSNPALIIPTVVALLSALVCLRRLRENLVPLGLAAIGVIIASRYDRYIYPAILLCTPVMGLAVKDARDGAARLGALIPRLVPWVVAVGLTAAHLQLAPRGLDTSFGFGADETMYPTDTYQTLKQLPRGRTLHSFGIGGWLIWQRLPGGVFADGRNVSVYSERHLKDFFVPANTNARLLEQVAERFNVTYGLAPYGTSIAKLMMSSGRWIPLHHGRNATLFVRGARARPLAERGVPLLNELRFVTNAYWMKRFYAAVLKSPSGRRGLLAAFRHALTYTPKSPVVVKVYAYLHRHHPAVAREIARSAP